jgi:FkbH-like protein
VNGHVLVVTDFLADNLVAQLERVGLSVSAAPFDTVEATLVDPVALEGGWTVVWTRPERAIPSFGRLLAYDAVESRDLSAEVETFAARVAAAAARARGIIVTNWTLPATRRGLGVLELSRGAGGELLRMNALLLECLSGVAGVHVLDAARWVALGGYSPKLWYLNKTPFDPKVLKAAALDIAAAIRGISGNARKILMLDLDDTLWGGIVGEEGWENLQLGGHDPIGEALIDFQLRLKALTRRGILLAVVSKNDEAVALEAIRSHPEMVLRIEDLAGWRINWHDKAANIAALAEELGLGLQSVVFIDDDPHERARVAEALPEVFVPEWPADKLLYPKTLDELDCFDIPALTNEDRLRGAMYVAERQRRVLQREVPSHEEWLRSLAITLHVEPYGPGNRTRIAQLLNKTNQFNLATRRMTEAELDAWLTVSGRRMLGIRVADRFGDAGLCGVIGTESGESLEITDLLLSCRVLGRRVEEAMLALACEQAREAGLTHVTATYVPTKKNRPTLDILTKRPAVRDGDRFTWDSRAEVFPETVTVKRGDGV